jgi:hypothetical protein
VKKTFSACNPNRIIIKDVRGGESEKLEGAG